MDILLLILAALSMLLGIIGCVIPALPSVPMAYVSILLVHWTDRVHFSWQFLVIWAVIVTVIQVLDFVIPAWGTKKFGGTKWGAWGSLIGLFVGLVLGPVGIILGPFVGAVIGEMLYFKRHPQTPSAEQPESVKQNTPFNRALRAGFGSFIGLLTGTLLKLACCGFATFYLIRALW